MSSFSLEGHLSGPARFIIITFAIFFKVPQFYLVFPLVYKWENQDRVLESFSSRPEATEFTETEQATYCLAAAG